VDDAGAHASQGRQFLRLDQLRLGVFELLDGAFENLVLLGQFLLILARFDEVLDADVQFGDGKRLGEKIAGSGVEGGQFGFFIGASGE
jgi:hypothetical protein